MNDWRCQQCTTGANANRPANGMQNQCYQCATASKNQETQCVACLSSSSDSGVIAGEYPLETDIA